MLWSWSSERFWQSHFDDLCPFRGKYKERDLGTSFLSPKLFYGIQVAKARKSRSNVIKINRTFRLTFFNHIDIIYFVFTKVLVKLSQAYISPTGFQKGIRGWLRSRI